MKLLEEAGVPPGVVNFVPGDPRRDQQAAARGRAPGGRALHRLDPRVPIDLEDHRRQHCELSVVPPPGGRDGRQGLHRGAPERQRAGGGSRHRAWGVRVSGTGSAGAASRVYLPESLWPDIESSVREMLATVRLGDPRDFGNYVGAVIDRKAWDKITGYIEHAKSADDVEIIAGRRLRRQHRLLHRADRGARARLRVPPDVRGGVRPRCLRLRLPGRGVGADAAGGR